MQPTKATIRNLDTGETIKCLFNPTEYTIQKSNNWRPQPVKGKNVPKLEFGGGGSRTMTFELLLDAFEKGGDVRQSVEKLWKLTMLEPKNKNKSTDRARPPIILFQWGGNWEFKAVVTSLSVRYIMFGETGKPTRAVANISLQEASDESEQPGTNPTSYAKPGYKLRETKAKDSLQLIAFEEYGDPNLWRRIASENSIDNPFALEAGTVLSIPPLN